MNTHFFVAAHALMQRDDGAFLILRRSPRNNFKPTWWDIPGGVVEAGESLEEALLRELKEEIGLTAKILEPLHTYTDLEDYPNYQIVQIIFNCFYIGGDITLNPLEHDAYEWVTLDSIPQSLNLLPFLSSYIQKNEVKQL